MTRKKLKWILLLLLVVGLTLWVASRWNAWFHNPEEPPYTASSTPHRVLLTYEAEAENITADQIIKEVFEAVDVP